MGIAATAAALGDPGRVAPFFRFPGFGHTQATEEYLASQGIMVWGADAPADDWHRISASEIARRAIRRLEGKGKGILLLHDIHARTVEALPIILDELKARGFRIVHVVPQTPERPATETMASAWRLHSRPGPTLPVIMIASVQNLDAESLAKLNMDQLCTLPDPAREARPLSRHMKGLREARHHREAGSRHEGRSSRETKIASADKSSREDKAGHESRRTRLHETLSKFVSKRHSASSSRVAGVQPKVPAGNSHAVE
jgi:hypothetical protein